MRGVGGDVIKQVYLALSMESNKFLACLLLSFLFLLHLLFLASLSSSLLFSVFHFSFPVAAGTSV